MEARRLRDEGLLLRQIGEQMGLSLKTVHDLIADPTGEKARARKAKNNGTCVGCGRETRNSGAKDAPERCQPCAATQCGTMEWRRNQGAKLAGRVRYTDDELLAALRRAAATTERELSVQAYEQARTEDSSLPSREIIQHRFGRWITAKRLAGISERTPYRGYSNTISEAACLEGLRVCMAQSDSLPTYAQYQAWHLEHGHPSAHTIRNKFGTWIAALDAADEAVAA